MAELEIRDKPSSIEVSQNAKGDYAHKVKLYFSEEDEDGEKVVSKIVDIYETLHKGFK